MQQPDKKIRSIYEFIEAKEYKKATKTCLKALQTEPHNSNIKILLALSYKNSGQMQSFQDIIGQLLQEKITEVQTLDLLFKMLREINRHQEVVPLYEQLNIIQPSDFIQDLLHSIYIKAFDFAKQTKLSMKIYKDKNTIQSGLHSVIGLFLQVYIDSKIKETPLTAYQLSLMMLQKIKQREDTQRFTQQIYKTEKIILQTMKKWPELINLLGNSEKMMFEDDYEPYKTKAKIYLQQFQESPLPPEQKQEDLIQGLNQYREIMNFNLKEEQMICIWEIYETYIRNIFKYAQLTSQKVYLDLTKINSEVQELELLSYPLIVNLENLSNVITELLIVLRQNSYFSDIFQNKSRTISVKRICSMAEMEIIRQLIFLYSQEPQICEQFQVALSNKTIEYIQQFYSIPSSFENVIPFIIYLKEEQHQSLANIFNLNLNALDTNDQEVLQKVLLTYKLRHFLKKNTEDVYQTSLLLFSFYQQILSKEQAPEAGKSRALDEILLLISEMLYQQIFQSYQLQNPLTNKELLNPYSLLIVSLLQMCLERSVYNFEIRFRLVLLLQQLSCVLELNIQYKRLDIKAVQHATLGWLIFPYLQQFYLTSTEFDNQIKSIQKYYNLILTDGSESMHQAFVYFNLQNAQEFYDFAKEMEKSYFSFCTNTMEILHLIMKNIKDNGEVLKILKDNITRVQSYQESFANNLQLESEKRFIKDHSDRRVCTFIGTINNVKLNQYTEDFNNQQPQHYNIYQNLEDQRELYSYLLCIQVLQEYSSQNTSLENFKKLLNMLQLNLQAQDRLQNSNQTKEFLGFDQFQNSEETADYQKLMIN